MNRVKIYACLFFLFLAVSSGAREFDVSVTGKGSPILLLPGFATTGEVYKDIVHELSTRYEVHTFTFAGFGGVPPIGFPWLPKIKNALSTYVKEQHIKKPVLIGHSLGGVLALWLAADEPATYAKVIVIDALPATGALVMPGFKPEHMVYESPYNQRIMKMSDIEFGKVTRQMAGSMSMDSAVQTQLADWMMHSDRKTFVYGYTDFLRLDLRDKLSEIRIPVAILAATRPFGKEVAEANYRKQYSNLKTYTLNFAEDSGHFMMYDQPGWLLQQIKTELQK